MGFARLVAALVLVTTLPMATGGGVTTTRSVEPRVAVLTYHDVSANPQGPFTITPDRLEADLRWFLSNDWRPLTMEEFREWMEGRRKLDRDSFLLTFDDGYAGLYEYAMPVLQRLGIPSTVFVITSHLEPIAAGKVMPKLKPDEITALASSGRVSFGSHTDDLHREAGTEGARQPAVFRATPEEVESDLATSDERLAQLTGAPTIALAWPFGKAPAWAEDVAKERFALIFTGQEGFVRQGRADAIPRFAMEWRTRKHLEQQFTRKNPVAAGGRSNRAR